VLRKKPGVLIVHRLGIVGAQADRPVNIEHGDDETRCCCRRIPTRRRAASATDRGTDSVRRV
jgi:hypothetical protein